MSRLADLVDRDSEALLGRWVGCLAHGLAPAGKSKSELRNHIPKFIAELVAALRAGVAPKFSVAAREHGEQREAIGFNVDLLVSEYGILRALILEAADAEGMAWRSSDVRVFSDLFSLAIAEGVTSYARHQMLLAAASVEESVRVRERVEMLADEVRSSAIELRLVTDALPVLVAFVKADERYRLVNKAYEQWFGQSSESLLGKSVREVVGEAAYEQLQPYVRRVLAGERFDFEHHDVLYRNGGPRDVRGRFVPHLDATGAVDGYVSLLEDITEQRRGQAERERLARQRSQVLESMGDVFFALNEQFSIDLVNRNFESVFKISRENAVGRSLWEVFPAATNPTSRFFDEYHRCMEERVDVQFVDFYPELEIWTDVRAYPTADGGIAVFIRDVSAEKRAEIALRGQANFEQQLIGIVSHDLRNPLNVIVLGSTLLARSEDLSERDTKSVVRIQNAADRATRLIRDLLDFTQARLGGGIGVEPRPSDLHAIVEGVLEEIEAAYPNRQIQVIHEGDGHGEWDPDRLGQVVQNLVTNALKYSSPGSAVQILTWGRESEVTLLFRNYGAPIPQEKLSSLFEPFSRAAAQIDRASRSVGLGLYIVKQLVDAHHGFVEVQSLEGEGTTFTVTLPRHAG